MAVDWDAVEAFITPLMADTLFGPRSASRTGRNARWLGQNTEPFNADRACLLASFACLREVASDPTARRDWVKPLRAAGVTLRTQTWLWIALERFEKAPAGNEEKAAHDAVALERVGAIGMARAIASAAQDGIAPLAALSRFYSQLAETVFLTPAGRRIGVRRMVVARRFLKELEEEEGASHEAW